MTEPTVLVTGGTGYIGSHTCVELITAGYRPVIVDNLSNSSAVVVDRVAQITGEKPAFLELDLNDDAALADVFKRFGIDAVLHFAGLKAVGESVSQPLRYFENNVGGTLCLLQAMASADVRKLVFSSSATVYGDPASNPIDESFPTSTTNPYGRSKLHIEQMLRDLCASDPRWQVSVLRYFNPVGAHSSGLIGEDPAGIPNNLLPFVAQVAAGQRKALSVFGGDYPTRDGTGVRDYIHVQDLARGHLSALKALASDPGLLVHNLGTGRGYSVLDMVAAFAAASGREIPYNIVARRPGDVAECYANPSLAQVGLGWQAEYDLARMCEDSWRWQHNNPQGY